MNDVLLTVSGSIHPETRQQAARGDRPQADYLALAQAMGADLLDYPAARQVAGRFGQFLERLAGPNLMLAWACFRLSRRYRAIFTDGEQIGIPLALLWKILRSHPRPRHLTIAHLISVRKKTLLVDLLGLHSHIDTFIVYASWQKNFIESRWQVPPERVFFTPFMVDDEFFSPELGRTEVLSELLGAVDRPVISSAGLEFRDYDTLVQAVEGLDVQVVIAAASPWSKRKDTTRGRTLPENVLVSRFSQYELRELYARSRFVVMPLHPVPFQAGVTAILEGMAMGKAIICTRTPGQTDIVVDGETGRYVPPGDPQALREAILDFLQHPETAARMGAAGLRRVEAEFSLRRYAPRLAGQVKRLVEEEGSPPERSPAAA